jgi:AcrR family transcriptional regulator
MPEPTEILRRRPSQRRSTERVARLLDSCAQVLDEVGYDGLTTREVARRAEVPIGTLYQFFGGKSALCRGLAERNLEAFMERLTARLDRDPVTGWQSTASVVVQEYVAMKREMPGFAVLDFGDPQPAQRQRKGGGEGLDSANRESINRDSTDLDNANELVANRLRPLAVQLGAADSGDLTTVLLVAVEIADSLVRLAFRFDPSGDPWLIAEAQHALGTYLDSRLGLPAPSASAETESY